MKSTSLKKFPFDVQICHFEVELRMPADEEAFETKPNVSQAFPANFISRSEVWHAERYEFSLLNHTCERGRTMHSRAVVTMHLRRLPALDVIGVFLPCIFLSFILLASVFIPPTASDRPVFCITVVLAFAVAQQTISDNIPKSADLPYALVFLNTQLAAASFVTMYTLAMCKLANNGTKVKLAIDVVATVDCFFYAFTSTILIFIDAALFLLIFS